jgi:beta-lactamase regulating signal transducer with metallopeptidase domain
VITPWLLYAALLGALIGCAALGVERLVGAGRRPVRGVWLAALAAAVLLPIVADLWLAQVPVVHTVSRVTTVAAPRVSLDSVLLLLWAAVSVLLVARMALAIWSLRNRRREWREITVDGRRVLLTTDTGPALVGLLQPQPVVPEWALAFSRGERELILRHEAEHARARDPWVLMAAAASVAAMPWNPALWWLSRRLRLAVEIDCDARVLRSGADARSYASLLLAVGERLSRAPLAGATALAEPRSLLERRVTAMIASKSYRRPAVMTAGLLAVVAGALVIACEAPLPDQALPATTAAVAAPAVPSVHLVYDTLIATTLDGQLRTAQLGARGVVSARYLADSAAVHADSIRVQGRGYQIEPLANPSAEKIVLDSAARAVRTHERAYQIKPLANPSHEKIVLDSAAGVVLGVPLHLRKTTVAGSGPGSR